MWPSSVVQKEKTSPQAKRSACDRCHDQKLRCTRPQEGESCVRCQRAGVFCNVSATQQTGRPRKSSGPRSERESPSNGIDTVADGASSDSESRVSALVSERSSESIRETSEPTQDTTNIPNNGESWDTVASNSSPSTSPASLPSQPYAQPLSTDDYGDLLDYITDQACFGNMDLPDFPESTHLPTLEPNPKKQKSNSLQSVGLYANHVSMSPPILDNQTSARITSFPEIDMPTITPVITTSSAEHSTTPDFVPSMSVLQSDSSHSQTLSKLQTEIDACSERIMHQARRMSTALNSYTNESQKLSEALGVLLSTAERFIELISSICRSFDTISPSRSPSPSQWYQQPNTIETQPNYFNTKMFFSPRANSLNPNVPSENRALSTTTFYTMLKCHVRLLSAYDTTLDTMSSRLLELENLDTATTLTSALSIGSFVVPFGAIIETLLHLQVISHQLDRMKTALHGNLLKLQPQRQVQGSISLKAQLGLCRQSHSASVSMVDFRLEEIQERERALQTKLLRIENLAESSKQGHVNREGFPSWI